MPRCRAPSLDAVGRRLSPEPSAASSRDVAAGGLPSRRLFATLVPIVERVLADLLTWLRAAAAMALAGLGIAYGRSSLAASTALLLFSWTSDAFDGAMGRRSGTAPSWIGAHDLEVDIAVSAGLGVWLVGAGFVPWLAAAAYLLVWAGVFTWLGVQRSPGMLVQAPVYLGFIVVALRDEPWAGASLLVWIATAVVTTWPRFPQEIAPEWVGGMRAAWRELRAHAPGRRRPEIAATAVCSAPTAPAGTTAQDGTLTVLSANLWHDWPRQRRAEERMEAFARLVEAEHADVVLLQEVMRASLLRVDERLAARLGMAYAYARANGDRARIGFEEGIAVFSRLPLGEARVQPLGVPGWWVRRLALAVRVEARPAPFWAVSVHLGMRPWRNAAQVRHLVEWVDALAERKVALVGGDFNAPEWTPSIAAARRAWRDPFRELHPHADAATFERPPLRVRLDYIFLREVGRGWRPVQARLIGAPGSGGHSDHRAVVVRFETDRAAESVRAVHRTAG
jgi:endonuclease/exonuclease/phosphatase family metal-dependent hydrolase